MSPLPRFIVLKSAYDGKYLSKMSTEETKQNGMPAAFLKFYGEEIASPFAKFEVEIAKKNREFVHIRCCHNNKYLTRRPDDSNSLLIVAAANEPIEADSAHSCTMFKPVQLEKEDHFRFLHVQAGNYACLWRAGQPYTNGLFAGSSSIDTESCDVFKVLDWDSLVIFPRTVAFKLSGDDRYLSLRWIEEHPYLQFVSTDSGDQTTANEISTFGDGYVRIKSLSTGKFWRRSPNWIWADSDDSTGKDNDTLFWPIKLADNLLALRNLGNNYFCKGLTTEGKTWCLNAAVPNITNEGKLVVEESVISRSIYNINFRPEEGRVYNLKVIEKSHAEADNYTNVENTVSLKFSYKKTSSSTFGGSVSLKLGVKTTVEIAAFPLIVDAKIEISGEVTTALQWAKTETVETLTETTYTARVPPMTKTIVTLIGTEGMCDVPFSYAQRDTLHNGNTSFQNMDDGIYKGVNMFGFKFKSQQEKLPAAYYR